MTAENGIHSFKILGLEKFLAIGMWWAPRGDEEILNLISNWFVINYQISPSIKCCFMFEFKYAFLHKEPDVRILI